MLNWQKKMILIYLYHQINQKKIFENHLSFLASKYKIILPQEKSSFFKISVCLSFDDATEDFYHSVYPLLKKYQAKALLAVPVKFIEKKGYCTWEQIIEMHNSPYVQIASHSFSHVNLLDKDVDLDLELKTSKRILEEKLNGEISTFVYPYGKMNRKLQKEVKKYYKYVMRIGSAAQFSWKQLLYRIPSDDFLNQNCRHAKLIKYITLPKNVLKTIKKMR